MADISPIRGVPGRRRSADCARLLFTVDPGVFRLAEEINGDGNRLLGVPVEFEDDVVVVEEKEDDEDVDVIVVEIDDEETVDDKYRELTSLDFGRRGTGGGPLLSASEGTSGARFAFAGGGPRDDNLGLGVIAGEDTLATIISHPLIKIHSFKP